jgi:hypothetical protein
MQSPQSMGGATIIILEGLLQWLCCHFEFSIAINTSIYILSYRNCELCYALGCLNFISIAPIVLSELHIIKQYKFVPLSNYVKITLLRYIT